MDKKETSLFIRDMFFGTLIEAWKFLRILLICAALLGALLALVFGEIWVKACVIGIAFLGICAASAYVEAKKRRKRRIRYRREKEECLQDLEDYKEKLAQLENSTEIDSTVAAQDIPFFKSRINRLEKDIAEYDRLIKDNGG